MRLGVAVELALGVVDAAGHGEHSAVMGHRHQRRLADVALLAFGFDPLSECAVRKLLEFRIEGRPDLQVGGDRAESPARARKSVEEGTRGSVRVDRGVRRLCKKNTK